MAEEQGSGRRSCDGDRADRRRSDADADSDVNADFDADADASSEPDADADSASEAATVSDSDSEAPGGSAERTQHSAKDRDRSASHSGTDDPAAAAGRDGETDDRAATDSARGGSTRRKLLASAGALAVGVGGWTALDNVVLGYGVLEGTNLYEQDLASRARERLGVHPTTVAAGDHEIDVDADSVSVTRDGEQRASLDLAVDAREDARRIDERYGLPGDPATQLYDDIGAIQASAADDPPIQFEFSRTEPFFDRVAEAEARPYTVAALRGPRFAGAAPSVVAEFTAVDPSDPSALVGGLATGFRTHSSYDVPRYLAGSVEDNLLSGATDLREHFTSPTDFEALLAGENTGLFCTELTVRSLEAFHAVSPPAQTAPVVGAFVQDERHKHAYTALASVVRQDGALVVPTTFVDYTHATLYDDARARRVLGEGIEAYDDRHRTTGIYWNQHAGV